MDDADIVCCFEAGRDADGELDGLLDRDGPTREPVTERVSLDVLEDEVLAAVVLFDAVDPRDVRMVELGERLALALEPLEPGRIRRQLVGERLDGDVTVEPCVSRDGRPRPYRHGRARRESRRGRS